MKSKKLMAILFIFFFLNPYFADAATFSVQGSPDAIISGNISSAPTQINAPSIRQTTPDVSETNNCNSNSDCGWCGNSCTRFRQSQICPAIMPPPDYLCVCSSGNCAEQKKTPDSTTNATIRQNTTINYNGIITYKPAPAINATIKRSSTDNNAINVVGKYVSNNTVNTVVINRSAGKNTANIVVLKNYTPVHYNGTLVYQTYTTNATLNLSPILDIKVEGVRLKESNVSRIIAINSSVYEITSAKKKKLFGIFPIDVDIDTRINTDTGEVMQMKKPWWSFFVR